MRIINHNFSAYVLIATLLAVSGCTKSHPVELMKVPNGESIFTVTAQGMRKVVARLHGNSVEILEWDLNLNEDGGIWWGGEKLFGLDDGRLIYCGLAFDPTQVQSCWVIDGKHATRIAEPILKPQPGLLDSVGRSIGFASDGAWWVAKEDGVEFSPARNVPAETLNLPVPANYQRAKYSPQSSRLAVTTGADDKCEIAIIKRENLELVDTYPLSSCYSDYAWNSDGKTLGIIDQNTLILWEPLGEKRQLTERAKGPDGRDEEIRLLGFSPDSTQALVRSSRHHKMAHNRCAGVHNPIFETFVIDLTSQSWKRLPKTGEVALWVKAVRAPSN